MSKVSLFLVSLVAAVPGGFVAYLMVMSFLNFAGNSSGAMKGMAGLTLAMGGLLAIMPLGILIFSGPKAEKKKPDDKKDVEDAGATADSGSSTALADDDDDAELFEDSGSEAEVATAEADDELFAEEGGEELAADDADEQTLIATADGDDDELFAGGETVDQLEIADDSSADLFSDDDDDLIQKS